MGHHAREELAKFGYSSGTKVDNFKNPAIFWQPARTHCLNIAISENFPSWPCVRVCVLVVTLASCNVGCLHTSCEQN
jgi:hypothetical protein